MMTELWQNNDKIRTEQSQYNGDDDYDGDCDDDGSNGKAVWPK